MTIALGTRHGQHEIVALIGGGGKRQVAIKQLPPDLTRDETAKQRFLQEAQAASVLDHLNICTIYEINEAPDGQLYLVVAHYEGETLKQKIERGPLAIDDAPCSTWSRNTASGVYSCSSPGRSHGSTTFAPIPASKTSSAA